LNASSLSRSEENMGRMLEGTVLVSLFLAVVLGASTTNTLARQSSTPLDRADVDAVISRFLASAERYEQTFRDLAAEETKTIEEFDERGAVVKRRQIVSDLIVYRSSREDAATAEYRDVQSVDGQLLGKREARALKILTDAADAESLQKELRRINNESMKYEFQMHWVGFTTNQAGWIKSSRNLFTFEWLGEDSLDGHDVVRIRYQQTTPRLGSFDVQLPSAFVPHSLLIRGTLWLERQTARVWRSEEDYTVRHRTISTPFVWARIEKTYASSPFDINVPERIVLTRFSRYRHSKNEADELALQDRTTLTYTNFRRFGVASKTEYQLPAAPGDGSR
jgi:hypothetical protein